MPIYGKSIILDRDTNEINQNNVPKNKIIILMGREEKSFYLAITQCNYNMGRKWDKKYMPNKIFKLTLDWI